MMMMKMAERQQAVTAVRGLAAAPLKWRLVVEYKKMEGMKVRGIRRNGYMMILLMEGLMFGVSDYTVRL